MFNKLTIILATLILMSQVQAQDRVTQLQNRELLRKPVLLPGQSVKDLLGFDLKQVEILPDTVIRPGDTPRELKRRLDVENKRAAEEYQRLFDKSETIISEIESQKTALVDENIELDKTNLNLKEQEGKLKKDKEDAVVGKKDAEKDKQTFQISFAMSFVTNLVGLGVVLNNIPMARLKRKLLELEIEEKKQQIAKSPPRE
jgi:hypothetical protein